MIEGSSVLFFAPPNWVREQVVPLFIRKQIPTLISHSHEGIKRCAEAYPGSLFFFNLDAAVPADEWLRIIAGLAGHLKTREVALGLCTKAEAGMISNAMKPYELPHRVVDSQRSPQAVLSQMGETLKTFYRPGRRKHLRVNCEDQARARFNIKTEGDLRTGRVHDISVAGMACSFDAGKHIHLKQNQKLERIQLNLGNRLALVDGVVAGKRETEFTTIYVVIFQHASDTTAQHKILDFISREMQAQFESKILSSSGIQLG
jgi:hypothetical protein